MVWVWVGFVGSCFFVGILVGDSRRRFRRLVILFFTCVWRFWGLESREFFLGLNVLCFCDGGWLFFCGIGDCKKGYGV